MVNIAFFPKKTVSLNNAFTFINDNLQMLSNTSS